MDLVIDDLSVRFGGVHALQDVSFTVPHGQLCALIGPNGAGKTSLLNVISGLYKPTSGSVSFGDVVLTDTARATYASLGVSRTFQNLALFSGMTVLENVMVGAHSQTSQGILASIVKTRAAREAERRTVARSHELLELLGVGHLADSGVDELSFGTLKRVELARALAAEPSLLLLDEPAAGLTHSEVDALGETLRMISNTGPTVLVVEHHMGLVMSISERVVALNFGRVMADGSPRDVAADPDVITAYLGAAS